MAENLVLSEQMSDVVLKVRHNGYSWRFPGHSLLLNARSSVLRDILEQRADDAYASPITIVGLEPETAVAILRYIYSGTLPTKVTANLIAAAEKYDLESLRDYLEEMVITDLTIQQACQMLNGFEHELPLTDDCALKTACFTLLESHAYTVFASDSVLNLSKNTLLRLLESDKLNVPDESVVFWGIWRWGIYNSSRSGRSLEDGNVSSYIHDILSLLR
nr:BTB/POZ domain-containing protein 9-like [Parasteatoda tepidariorum]